MVAFTFACPAMRPSRLWPSLSGEPPLNKLVPSPSACIEKSTQWSPCSRSCGAGVSTRVSNQNPACKLQMETRLCKVRPCSMTQPAQKRPVVSSLIVSYQLVPHLSRSQDLVFTRIHIQYILLMCARACVCRTLCSSCKCQLYKFFLHHRRKTSFPVTMRISHEP